MEQLATSSAGLVIGRLTETDGELLVEWSQDGQIHRHQPVAAAWNPAFPDLKACLGSRVAMGFEGANPARPIVLAVLDAPRVLKSQPGRRVETTQSVIRFDAEKEIVLACGKARISLRADGRISILGGYVLSRSTGANKIKGGSIQLN